MQIRLGTLFLVDRIVKHKDAPISVVLQSTLPLLVHKAATADYRDLFLRKVLSDMISTWKDVLIMSPHAQKNIETASWASDIQVQPTQDTLQVTAPDGARVYGVLVYQCFVFGAVHAYARLKSNTDR